MEQHADLVHQGLDQFLKKIQEGWEELTQTNRELSQARECVCVCVCLRRLHAAVADMNVCTCRSSKVIQAVQRRSRWRRSSARVGSSVVRSRV